MFEILYLFDVVINFVTIIALHDFAPNFHDFAGAPLLMEDDPVLSPAYEVMNAIH